MQATQAKLEIRSRIKALFSATEREARRTRHFNLYTENPHVIEGTLAATQKIDEGSLTARFVKRVLVAESFTGAVELTQDQVLAQKKKAAARSKQRLIALCKTVPASLYVAWKWLTQPRNTAIASLIGICVLSYRFIDSQSVSAQPKSLVLAGATSTDSQAAPQPESPSESNGSSQAKNPNQTTAVELTQNDEQVAPKSAQIDAGSPVATVSLPLPIPGFSLPASSATVAFPVNDPEPTSSKQSPAKTQRQGKPSDQEKQPTSIALKGELAEPIKNEPAIAEPLSDKPAAPVKETKSRYEIARWGDQSQLLAFSANGLIAMVNGRPAEIAAGQALPNGEILRSIDKAQSLVVTDQRTIQLTE